MTSIAACPSRQRLERGARPRADLAENLSRAYEAIWRNAIKTHNANVYTTWEQLGLACGYEASSVANTERALRRWLDLFAEAGLISYGGDTDEFGRWLRLRITLLQPPAWLLSGTGPCSSAGSSNVVCEARRRRETRSQRHARRVKPWRRQGGRGTPGVKPRFDFFWGANADSVVPGRPSGTTSPRGGQASGEERRRDGANGAENGLSARPGSGSRRAGAARPISEVAVANTAGGEAGAPAAAVKPGSVPRCETDLALREADSWLEARWDWLDRVGPRLDQLTALRFPGYADVYELAALAVAGGGLDPRPVKHARLKTRLALEREAARYDRYAARLAADGAEVSPPAAMEFLAGVYAEGGYVSAGAPLSRLGKAARELRRRWHQLHPDLKARRRRERAIAAALKRSAEIGTAPLRMPFRVDTGRRHVSEDLARRRLAEREGDELVRQLLERPEADGC